MPSIIPFQIVFAAVINAIDIADSIPVKGGTLVDIGTGFSEITLDDGGVSANECVCSITPRLFAGSGKGKIFHSSDIVKLISMTDSAGTAADINAEVFIIKII